MIYSLLLDLCLCRAYSWPEIEVYEFLPEYCRPLYISVKQILLFLLNANTLLESWIMWQKIQCSGIHGHFYFFQITLSPNYSLHLLKNTTSRKRISPFSLWFLPVVFNHCTKQHSFHKYTLKYFSMLDSRVEWIEGTVFLKIILWK